MDLQTIPRVAIFNDSAHSIYHFVKLRPTGCRKSLGVCLLKEPKFLKCDNGVAASDLEVELETHVSFVQPVLASWKDIRSAQAPPS